MELVIAHLINLILISIFTGTEFAVGVLVHPVLRKLPIPVHISSVQKLGKIIGKIMPIWTPLIIISTLPILYFTYNTQTLSFWLTIGGAVCIALMIIISLTINVPINKKVIEWDPNSPPNNWSELRSRWDNWHTVRMILDITALLLFLLAAII